MESFEQASNRIKAEVKRDELDGRRMVGTALEPRRSKLAGNRYCAPCDEWMRARVCRACGMDTEKGS